MSSRSIGNKKQSDKDVGNSKGYPERQATNWGAQQP